MHVIPLLNLIRPSFSSFNKIQFRNRENLGESFFNYSVAPHKPGALCSVSPSILVYENISKNPRQLHWLDCSEADPKSLAITADTNFTVVQDVCTAELEKEKLLIVISYDANELIHAYNSTTGELKWSAETRTPTGTFISRGVAGDGNGRLFFADNTNDCIQRFSASDGQYMGCFMKRGDQGLGHVTRLGWNEATSSLVVGHLDGDKYTISDIH